MEPTGERTMPASASVLNPRKRMNDTTVSNCICCGSERLKFDSVLWPELIREWELSEEEAAYIDRQQGFHCVDCGSNLRSMALAQAIMACLSYEGTFDKFVRSFMAKQLKILEVNTAGNLTQFLKDLPGHTLVTYPEYDMTALRLDDHSFDLVVHSDTLEHVPSPIKALSECRRILKKGGFCAFTVPLVVGRLTRSRQGLPASYHGAQSDRKDDFLVQTEYGCDFWQHLVLAGFRECRIFCVEYPAAQAVVGVA